MPIALSLLFFSLNAAAEAPSFGNPDAMNCIRPSDLTGFAIGPNCYGVDTLPGGRKYVFKTNQMGLRDKEFSPHPARGTYRILFFGASQGVDVEGLSIAKVMEEKLRKTLPARCRFRRVEVINASLQGGDVLRTYLSLPRLLSAYDPSAVYVVDTLQSHGMQQYFFYRNAVEMEGGLVKALGLTNFFWPLPLSWSRWIITHVSSRFHQLRYWAQGIRMAAVQAAVELGLFRGSEGRSPYLDVHLRHLDAIASRLQDRDFVVINLNSNRWDPSEIFNKHNRAKVAPAKAEHIANKLMPHHYLRRADLEQLESWSKSHYVFLDVTERLASSEMASLYRTDDVHFNLAGIRRMGEEIASAAAAELAKACRK